MHLRQRLNSSLLIILIAQVIIYSHSFGQECKAKVQITAGNNDSMIYVDSVLIGNGKINMELKRGNHLLLIKESSLIWGIPPVRDSLRITDCSKSYLFNYGSNIISLNENRGQIFLEPVKRSESFFSSNTFKILVGSAAVLGGVAAYLKIKADRKYDDYLQSKNQSILDEVNRLDLYSGISFGLLQINVGYLIYKFLTD